MRYIHGSLLEKIEDIYCSCLEKREKFLKKREKNFAELDEKKDNFYHLKTIGEEDIIELTEKESNSIEEFSPDIVMTPIPLRKSFIMMGLWKEDGSYNDKELKPIIKKQRQKNLVFLMCDKTDNSGIVKSIEGIEGLHINPENKTWSYKGCEDIPYGQKIKIGNETYGVYYRKRHGERIIKDMIKGTEM